MNKRYHVQVFCHTFRAPRLYDSDYRGMKYVTQTFGVWNSDIIVVSTRKWQTVAVYAHTPEGNKYFRSAF